MQYQAKIEIEVLISEALASKMRAVVFVPEEEEIFCYFLTPQDLLEIRKIPKDFYDCIQKEINIFSGKTYNWGESVFYVLSHSSCTSFGQRLVIEFLPENIAKDDLSLKDIKSKIIKDINKFLPATSLTHKNVANLMKLVRKYSPFRTKKLGELMSEEGLGEEIKLSLPRKLITLVLGRWLDVPYVDLEEAEIDDEILKKISKEACLSLMAVPFGIENNKLCVAMFDPLDKFTQRAVGEASGMDIKPFIAPEGDIRITLEEKYGR